MGITDYGSQTLTFDYNAPGRSKDFNKLNYSLTPTGIYSGAILSKVNSSVISVSPLICVIQDDENDINIRISTSESVNISVDPSTLYIVLSFSWSNIANNFMDFSAKAYDNIQDDDLIVGKCIYKSNILQSSFDYSRSTNPLIQELKTNNDKLKVLPTEPYSNKIIVLSGKIIFEDGEIVVEEQTSTAISNTILGRIDLIYIDSSGDIQIEEGVDTANPLMPSFGTYKVVAYITRGASESVITGDDITLITGIDARVEGISPLSAPPVSVYICAENIATNKVVALDNTGKAIIASKDDASKVEVVGISTEAKNNGEEITVQKLTTLSGFAGLTAGEAYYLGNNGALVLESSISNDEYRVYIGIAKSATILDISVEEATLYLHPATEAESIKAGFNITGGGIITLNGSYYLKWSTRFIVICAGRGSHFSTIGFFNIGPSPTSGAVTVVGGAAARNWTADGVLLDGWEALYYILPIGSNGTSLAANFRICNYTSDVEIPYNWILLAIRNHDSDTVQLGVGGEPLHTGQSYTPGTRATRLVLLDEADRSADWDINVNPTTSWVEHDLSALVPTGATALFGFFYYTNTDGSGILNIRDGISSETDFQKITFVQNSFGAGQNHAWPTIIKATNDIFDLKENASTTEVAVFLFELWGYFL